MFTAKEIADELERTIPVMQDAAEESMHAMLDVAERCWAEAAPRGATGKVANNTRQTVRRNATGVSGSLAPSTPEGRLIAGYLDKGTGLWVQFHSAITPKAARGPRARLRFADGTFRRSSKGRGPPTSSRRQGCS